MAFIAKLLIDGKEIDVLSYKFGFKKDTDIQCKSTALTHLKGVEIEIEATESSYFEEWMTSAKPKQKIALQTFYPHLNGASKTTVFYDCYLIGNCATFSATNNQLMKEKLKIACAGVKAPYSQRQYAATWRKTFEKEQSYKTPVVGFEEKNKYDEQIKVIDKHGYPISDLFYCVEYNSNIIFSGRTDSSGKVKRTTEKNREEKYIYFWGDEAILKAKKS